MLDAGVCVKDIGRCEFSLRHALTQHPLLSMEAIAALADELPSAAVERHAASQPLLVPGGAADMGNGGSPSETTKTMDGNRLWMVLWNIEQIPRYRELLDAILDEAESLLPPREQGMGRREAFLFVSAPHAVTPVHFDPEHNFLLQIRGSKELNIGRFSSREAELRELDRYHNGGHRNLVEIPPLSSMHRLRPGNGAYLYPWAPHWVYNGAVTSVSLSITFRTRLSEREELVHQVNGWLRRHGRSPRPAGQSPRIDRTKAGYARFAGWVQRGGRRERGTRDYR
ncbi:MAG: transcriptional regulator [Gammaproteobacteria bacterium]